MNQATPIIRGPEFFARAERRTALLTLAIGAAAAGIAFFAYSPRAAFGVAIGALLAWINYRWLRDAANAITSSAVAQSDVQKPRISPLIFLKVFARYALIGVVIYVIFTQLRVPVVSVLAGLCSLGAAVIAHSLYEVFSFRKH